MSGGGAKGDLQVGYSNAGLSSSCIGLFSTWWVTELLEADGILVYRTLGLPNVITSPSVCAVTSYLSVTLIKEGNY